MCASGSTTTVSTGTFTKELYFRATHHHSIFADAVKTIADRHGVSNGEAKPHTTGRPAVLRGLTGGSSFDGA